MLISSSRKSFIFGALIALAIVAGAVFIEMNLIQIPNNPTSGFCPALTARVAFYQGFGFLLGNSKQFVIPPNSTAFLQTMYTDMIYGAQSVYNSRDQYFLPIEDWYSVNGTDLSASAIGLDASPINVTLSSNDSLSVIYEIHTSVSAQRGTFAFALWSSCGSVAFLTVGWNYYNDPLPVGVVF